MARAHITSPVVDSYGHPVGGARVEAYDVTDDSLLETQYTAATGIATFAALHDTHDADVKITWGLFNVVWRRHIFATGGGGGTPEADHGALTGLGDDDHTQYIKHSLATAVNDFLAASGSGAFVKKTLAQTLTILGKAAASGLASLNASSKVVQQPAAITDHLENPPTEDEATKAPTSEYAYDTKVQMIDGPLSPMILTGGLISEGTEGTVTISALTALLRTGSGDADPLTYVTLAEQANQTMVAADTKYHIVLKTYASPAIAIQEAAANGTTEIGLGICMKDTSDPVKVHFQNTGMRLQGGLAKLHKRAATLRASELASGCGIADVGGGSRQFTIATGVVYHGIHRLTPFAAAPYNPFNSNDDKFTYIYGDTSNGFTFSDGTDTVINNTQYYDGAGALATLGTNKYGCHWVYIHPDENHVYVVYGTTNGKLAEAEQAFAPSDLPIELDEFGLLLGCIIIEKDATAFTTIQMVTDTFFTGTAVGDHGSLGGLDDEADHLYALLKDGTRNLEGNLAVDAGVTIDGVDLSEDAQLKADDRILADGKNLQLYDALGTDHTVSGLTFQATAGENVTFGQTVYMKSDGKLWRTDSTDSATLPCIALVADATIAADATGTFLLEGFARDDTWDWTTGDWLYLGGTGGLLEHSILQAGQYIQFVAVALSADIIRFRPAIDFFKYTITEVDEVFTKKFAISHQLENPPTATALKAATSAWSKAHVDGADPHPVYPLDSEVLKKDGSAHLTGNLAVDAGVTIDGVDVDAHHSRHEFGGADEISVAGLSGLLAADQHVIDAEVTNVAIAKALLTTAGDIIKRGAAAPERLGIGANAQVLTVVAGAPAWAAGGGGAGWIPCNVSTDSVTHGMADGTYKDWDLSGATGGGQKLIVMRIVKRTISDIVRAQSNLANIDGQGIFDRIYASVSKDNECWGMIITDANSVVEIQSTDASDADEFYCYAYASVVS